MSIQISDDTDGILTVRVSGRLTESELTDLQNRTAAAIGTHGRVRILVIAERFEGWQRGRWDDFSFEEQYDPNIERMAIVGDRQWKDLALIFACKGIRPFPIEYFTPSEIEKARTWLTGP